MINEVSLLIDVSMLTSIVLAPKGFIKTSVLDFAYVNKRNLSTATFLLSESAPVVQNN